MEAATTTVENKELHGLSVAFVQPEPFADYSVYLVNNTETRFIRVVTFTGMFASVGEGLLESSRALRERGELPPRSFLLLEDGPFVDLDFVIWYHLNLYPENNNKDPLRVWFSIPKGGPNQPDTTIPVLGQMGRTVELSAGGLKLPSLDK